MQSEMLVHAMLPTIVDIEKLILCKKQIVDFALQSRISGCLLLHRSEVIHYISGKDSDISEMLRIMKNSESFDLVKTLYSGTRNDKCEGMWNFVTTNSNFQNSNESVDLGIDVFLEHIKTARKVSLGLKLFSSLAEILVSEKVLF